LSKAILNIAYIMRHNIICQSLCQVSSFQIRTSS
jgi:hypothetical protein